MLVVKGIFVYSQVTDNLNTNHNTNHSLNSNNYTLTNIIAYNTLNSGITVITVIIQYTSTI